jgi:ABC-type oligopeptide transport system substrate-binding subunit
MKLGSLYHAAYRFEDSRRAYREGFSEERDASGVPRRGERAGHVLPPAPHPLRLAGVDPVTLDPGLTADIWDAHLAEQLFSGLLYCDPDMALLPEIAWRWEILEGGKKYLFHLRDDWRWSDGVAVTAEDFEFAWRRVLDPRTHSPSWHLLTNIHGGAAFDPGAEPPVDDLGIHAAGDWTLVVELEEPAGYFLHLLALPTAFPVPRHVVEAYGDKWTEAPHFVSNGPFRLEARASGAPWVLGLRPDYPGRVRGNVEQVEIVRLREGTHEIWDPVGQSMSLYEQGRIDVAQTDFLGSSRARQQYAREEVAWPWLGTFSLWPNWRRRPLDDPRVRQALGLGMDRSLVVALTYGEAAIPADGGFVARGVPGHSPGIGLPFDPDQARRLLSEAGFPGGRGFPSICLLHSMVQQSYDLARNLAEQWEETLGIRIESFGVDYYTYMDRIRAREYDLFFICWTADYPDPDTFLRGALANSGSLEWSEEYAKLVTEAARPLDQKTRFELYARADRMICEQAIILPVAYNTACALMKPWIRREPKWYARGGCWKDVIIDPH